MSMEMLGMCVFYTKIKSSGQMGVNMRCIEHAHSQGVAIVGEWRGLGLSIGGSWRILNIKLLWEKIVMMKIVPPTLASANSQA